MKRVNSSVAAAVTSGLAAYVLLALAVFGTALSQFSHLARP